MRSTVGQTLLEVPLDNGTTWRGTERELRANHPNWLPYARIVQPGAEPVQDLEPLALDLQDDPHPGRISNSARRYWQPVEYELQEEIVQTRIPPRRSAHRQTEERPVAGAYKRKPHPNVNRAQPPEVIHVPATQTKRKISVWFWVGIGMLVMLALWVSINWLATWATNTHNDITYTAAFRTYSVDAVVGHNNDSLKRPSHFIVQNDKRHIIIVELPADDPAKALIYLGPQLLGDDQERTPVTVSFQVNASTGKVDMILHVQDQTYIFTNNGKKFLPQSQQ